MLMLDFHKNCRDEISYLRQQVNYLQAKCDRLTEAVTKKENQMVIHLPDVPVSRADIPVMAPASVASSMPTEPSDTWSKGNRWFGAQDIATPPREQKISAPTKLK